MERYDLCILYTPGLTINATGDFVTSDTIISGCLEHATQVEEQATLFRLRSHNHWGRGDFAGALNDALFALRLLGIELNPTPTRKDAATMFEQVKNEILAVGFDEILSIPRATDSRTELAVALLNDAGAFGLFGGTHGSCNRGIHAYWSPSAYPFADVVGLTVGLSCGCHNCSVFSLDYTTSFTVR